MEQASAAVRRRHDNELKRQVLAECAEPGASVAQSSCKPVSVSEVKRNCMRVTDCGKEAQSVNHEPMVENQIAGNAEQGERA